MVVLRTPLRDDLDGAVLLCRLLHLLLVTVLLSNLWHVLCCAAHLLNHSTAQ